MDNISVWAAIWAGLASFITPCVLPLVPVYFASLAGPAALEENGMKRLTLFLHALFFVLGFTVVYTLMGALVGLTGFFFSPLSLAARWISGGLLVFFGLFMLASLWVPWLNFEKRLSPRMSENTSYLRSFLIGAVFPLGWTACTGPILGSILGLASASDTAWRGAFLLLVYSLGLGIPFLLMGLFFGSLRPVIRKIAKFSRVVYAVSGVLLIAVGIVVLTGNIYRFSSLW